MKYKGKGKHSVDELELIIKEQAKLIEYKSFQLKNSRELVKILRAGLRSVNK